MERRGAGKPCPEASVKCSWASMQQGAQVLRLGQSEPVLQKRGNRDNQAGIVISFVWFFPPGAGGAGARAALHHRVCRRKRRRQVHQPGQDRLLAAAERREGGAARV